MSASPTPAPSTPTPSTPKPKTWWIKTGGVAAIAAAILAGTLPSCSDDNLNSINTQWKRGSGSTSFGKKHVAPTSEGEEHDGELQYVTKHDIVNAAKTRNASGNLPSAQAFTELWKYFDSQVGMIDEKGWLTRWVAKKWHFSLPFDDGTVAHYDINVREDGEERVIGITWQLPEWKQKKNKEGKPVLYSHTWEYKQYSEDGDVEKYEIYHKWNRVVGPKVIDQMDLIKDLEMLPGFKKR